MVSGIAAGDQVLIVEIGEAEYGINAAMIKEIARMVETTPVPEAPTYVVGAIDYRGQLVIVVDLGARLALGPSLAALSSYIVIVDSDGKRAGLVVDKVRDVIDLEQEFLMGPPADLSMPEELVAGAYEIDDRLLLLLDVTPVVNFSDAELLRNIEQKESK
jgi:purine-binding chemotaxis protein CheW